MPAHTEHFNSGTRPISLDVFLPTTRGRHPAALILHGTFGLLPEYRPDIVAFAEALAGSGTVAMLPHYFDRTGTAAGLDAGAAIPSHLEEWKEACGDALTFARGHASVDPGRLAVIGFSLGGHLALDLAMAPRSGTGPQVCRRLLRADARAEAPGRSIAPAASPDSSRYATIRSCRSRSP